MPAQAPLDYLWPSGLIFLCEGEIKAPILTESWEMWDSSHIPTASGRQEKSLGIARQCEALIKEKDLELLASINIAYCLR